MMTFIKRLPPLTALINIELKIIVVRTEGFHGIPKKIGISQYSFLSKLYFNSQHRCVALLYYIPLGIFNCVLCGHCQLSSVP